VIEPDLGDILVILCRADEAGNVGSVCRAMKTMGVTKLVLAACPTYDEGRLRSLAVHAADVYEQAERFPDLSSALAGMSLSAGFTRRRGERRKSFSMSIENFARRFGPGHAPEQAMAASLSSNGRMALVFGNERTGLTDEELALCSLAVHIPTAAAFPSLNLAQAVQIACYELRKNALGKLQGSYEPATRSDVNESVSRITRLLKSLGFFKIIGDEKVAALLRDLAERASLSPGELRHFEALFFKTAALAAKSRGKSGGEND
jgi:TrmH family RNA methyltransferase